MLHHAIEALTKRRKYAEMQIAALAPAYDARGGDEQGLTVYYQSVIADCTDALNVLNTENLHRDLKRKGIR